MAINPIGKLLDQHFDLESPMGIAYERSIGFEKEMHSHGRHMLVCPRGPSRMEIRRKDRPKEAYRIDSTRVLWVPREVEHDDLGTSAIYDTLALYPSDEYFEAMILDNGLGKDDRTLLNSTAILFKRTKWLDDILDRYFFERVLNRHSPPGCTFFLEKQILNEAARILFRDKLQQEWGERDAAGKGTEPIDLAVRFIEANLFAKLDLEQIAHAAKASESTLLRRFKSELGQKPYEYIQTRRLDEALALLKKGEHAVGDVALLVGYEDFSAFSRAFRKQFKKPPSAFSRSQE